MFFHKRFVIINVLFIFTSVTTRIITAVGNNEDAGTSGYCTAPQSFTAIEGESDEEMKEYNSCWEHMRCFTNKDKPEAIDFAKSALAKWRRGDLDHNTLGTSSLLIPLKLYYHMVSDVLNAEDIEDPNTYCLNFDYEKAPYTGGVKQCQYVLRKFADSNHKALNYGYYQLKVPSLGDSTDSETLNNAVETFRKGGHFTECYMIHMIQKVKVYPGIINSYKFCKKYEEDEKYRQKVHKEIFNM